MSNKSPGVRACKLLNRWGYGTNGEIRRWFKEGRIAIDGVDVPTPDCLVPHDGSGVRLDGAMISSTGADARTLSLIGEWLESGWTEEEVVAKLKSRGLYESRARRLYRSAFSRSNRRRPMARILEGTPPTEPASGLPTRDAAAVPRKRVQRGTVKREQSGDSHATTDLPAGWDEL